MVLLRQNAKQCSQIKSIEYFCFKFRKKNNNKTGTTYSHYKYNMLETLNCILTVLREELVQSFPLYTHLAFDQHPFRYVFRQ